MMVDEDCLFAVGEECLWFIGHIWLGFLIAVVFKTFRGGRRGRGYPISDAPQEPQEQATDEQDVVDANNNSSASVPAAEDEAQATVESDSTVALLADPSDSEIKACIPSSGDEEKQDLAREIARLNEVNAQWAAAYAEMQAWYYQLQHVNEQNTALTKENADLKAAQDNMKSEHNTAMDEMQKALEKCKDELKNQADEFDAQKHKISEEKTQEPENAKDESQEPMIDSLEKDRALVNEVLAENNQLRWHIYTLQNDLYIRTCQLDDITGKLQASRYMVNYLQNRPEFQHIPAEEIMPPEFRSKPAHDSDKCKTVTFEDEVEAAPPAEEKNDEFMAKTEPIASPEIAKPIESQRECNAIIAEIAEPVGSQSDIIGEPFGFPSICTETAEVVGPLSEHTEASEPAESQNDCMYTQSAEVVGSLGDHTEASELASAGYADDEDSLLV